jgi:hypothetical protein
MVKSDPAEGIQRTVTARMVYGMYWWRCDDCDFEQVDPMPENILAYYTSNKYRDTDEPTDQNILDEENRIKGWIMPNGKSYISLPVASHLDVGSAAGKTLEFVNAETQLGVEPGPWRKAYNSVSSIKEVDGLFELITCFHTLEHVPDPIPFLRDIRDVLDINAPQPQVCVEIPQYRGKFPHLLRFSETSLLRVMEAAGLPATIVENARHLKAKH